MNFQFNWFWELDDQQFFCRMFEYAFCLLFDCVSLQMNGKWNNKEHCNLNKHSLFILSSDFHEIGSFLTYHSSSYSYIFALYSFALMYPTSPDTTSIHFVSHLIESEHIWHDCLYNSQFHCHSSISRGSDNIAQHELNKLKSVELFLK